MIRRLTIGHTLRRAITQTAAGLIVADRLAYVVSVDEAFDSVEQAQALVAQLQERGTLVDIDGPKRRLREAQMAGPPPKSAPPPTGSLLEID